MGITNYTRAVNTKNTPQTQPIPGSNQVANSAGGFSFDVGIWQRLERFLILGSEGGSYYATERKLTLDNADSVVQCIKEDGVRVVDTVAQISEEARAPKNDAAIFVLALCMKQGDADTKKAAEILFNKIVRIGTHLFQAATALDALGGWGRSTKRVLTNWYASKNIDQLAYQLVKYQSRESWSHRDLLRKLHIKPNNQKFGNLFKWAVNKEVDKSTLPEIVQAHEMAKVAKDADEIVMLIEKHNLPRECIPTEFLNSVKVWRALLMSNEGMPMTAMVRNLAKMTAVGLLTATSDETRFICKRLLDADMIKMSKIHPMQILMALSTYSSGHGLKGSLSWNPVKKIVSALNDAFYLSFKNVTPTGKRIMIALDVSGSMHGGTVAGSFLTPAQVAVAMALVTMNVEQDVSVYGFGGTFQELPFTKRDTLESAVAKIANMNFGTTDCSLPMEFSIRNKAKFDAFFVYTDNETYAGARHPSQALVDYRQKSGIPAKLVVVGMVTNGFTIADPKDGGMLDVVGFDTAAPALMADFIR